LCQFKHTGFIGNTDKRAFNRHNELNGVAK
jgi:hypothetical protein